MKKWWILVIILSVMQLVILVNHAAAQSPTPTLTPTPATIARIEGTISSIDLQAKTVTVTSALVASATLTITSDTEINVWGKEPATIQDLVVGQRIEATYNQANMQAIKIDAKRLIQPPQGTRQGYFGTISGMASSSFTISTKQATVTFNIDANTQFWNPPSKTASFSDLKAGQRIAVMAEKVDASLIAKRVMIIPLKPVHEQIQGVVTKISGTDITLTYDTDKTITGQAPPGVVRKIQLGDLAIASIIRTPGIDKVTITDIETSNNVLDRLNGIAQRKSGKEKDDVQSLMENARSKHIEVLQRVLNKAPDEAKQGLQNAIERSKSRGKPGGKS